MIDNVFIGLLPIDTLRWQLRGWLVNSIATNPVVVPRTKLVGIVEAHQASECHCLAWKGQDYSEASAEACLALGFIGGKVAAFPFICSKCTLELPAFCKAKSHQTSAERFPKLRRSGWL